MAQKLSGAQFTLGPNNTVAIYDDAGEVDWGIISTIRFMSNPVQNTVNVDLMSGYRYELIFNHGWSGEMDLQRFEGKLDAYWSQLEANVRSGSPYPRFTIIQTIRETSGKISRYTFLQAAIRYTEAGTFENEQGVVQRLSFTCPERLVTYA